jgi:hypothetical protein
MIDARAITAVSAIWLSALSIVLTASATGADDAAAPSQLVGVATPPSTNGGTDSIEEPAGDPAVSAEAVAAGHDKCKRPKGNRRLLPWCTDPAGGWLGSTTSRVHNDTEIPTGICEITSVHPSSRCMSAHPIPTAG